MIVNNDSAIVKAYLQDNNYNVLFDSNGVALEGDSVTDINTAKSISGEREVDSAEQYGGVYGLDTSKANQNGTYRIDKNLGVLRFSSDVKGATVVIEYITDGLNHVDDADVRVNKLAEDYLYKYIASQILKYRYNIQEYIVRRAKDEAFAALRNTKIRMMNLNPADIAQAARGRDKWIK